MAKQVVSVKLHPERLARLDAMATDLGMSRTAAVEAALDAWTDPPPTAAPTIRSDAAMVRTIPPEAAAPFTLDGEEPEGDPDQPLLDLAAQPPSNPWGI